jgi:hypothetical protein
MFGPKHTVESVTRRIIDGLHDGTVTLPPEEEPISVADARVRLLQALSSFRSRAWTFLALTIILAIASAALAVSIVLSGHGEESIRSIAQILIALFCFSGVFLAGTLIAFLRAREKATELKVYCSVLKMADEKTAQRLAVRISRKLPKSQAIVARP